MSFRDIRTTMSWEFREMRIKTARPNARLIHAESLSRDITLGGTTLMSPCTLIAIGGLNCMVVTTMFG